MNARVDTSAAAASGVADRPLSVLLVDDHESFRRAARQVLRAAPGFEPSARRSQGRQPSSSPIESRPESC